MIILRQTYVFFRAVLLGMAILLFLPEGVQASSVPPPTPRLKPEAPNVSSVLSRVDASRFRRAMRAADLSKWPDVLSLSRRLADPTARKIIRWRMAAEDPYVSFSILSDVVHNQSDWPRMTRIRAKAEAHMFDHPLAPDAAINWFEGEKPVSGEGRAVMAIAYDKRGQKDLARQWLKSAWRNARLSRDRQKTLYNRFKGVLTPEDHAARADHLIWLGRHYYSSASGLLSLMKPQDRALMDARIKIGGNRRGIDKAIKAVPKSLLHDTGLLYERAVWRRKHVSESSAIKALLQITEPPRTDDGKKRLWQEKKRLIYWALEKKRYADAYQLTRHHGLKRGEAFAEAEFLAGWLSLTKLNQPRRALGHFTRLKNNVSLPVSVGRASYWMGRAAQKSGDANARAYYADAARYPNVYYGQLAAAHLGAGFARLSLPPEITPGPSKDFENRELIRALRLIGEMQNETTFNRFSFYLDDILENPEDLIRLSQLSKSYGFMKPAIRAAKQAGRFDAMLTESAYPLPELITNLSARYDIPFVLAIARQESEFNTNARSYARAYGMMQMIHSTAKRTARAARMPYQRSWLTGDPEYATRLGAQHLEDLRDKFDGSYILAAAAYNAGGRRVREWLKTYGDPRTGQIDAIDWVESIPFSQTRNYVQRVMENLEVYRARLNGNTAKLQIMQDMNR